ncbi:MAG: FtsX-like permease family protein [Bacteroidetes bacterium]|jgi:putative ABC transport system permease protein|nr:FtsX-like permease family protein [Bacteroidota bacterium]
MLRNYLKVALRNLWRHRQFSLINIFSLAVSLAVCLLLVVFLFDQWQHDRHHEHADRLYRVVSHSGSGEFASSPARLGPTLQDQYPGIEAMTRLDETGGYAVFEDGSVSFRGFYAEPDFFTLFDWPLRVGSASALNDPNQALLSEEWATRAFGDSDPMGATIEFDGIGTFTVAGIVEAPPGRSHLSFDLLLSFATQEAERGDYLSDWQRTFWSYHNYLLLAPGVSPDQFNEAFASIRAEHFPAAAERGDTRYSFRLQAVTDIALGPFLDNDPARGVAPAFIAYFLLGLGLLILIATAFTFTNLSLARAFERTREVGVRKTLGAQRGQVAGQFIVEAVVMAFVALGIALLTLPGLIAFFNNLFIADLAGIQLTFAPLQEPVVLLLAVLTAVLLGLVAGLYPAWALSTPSPIDVMAGRTTGQQAAPVGRARLRRTLVGVQLVISFVLIVSTLLLYRQASYMMEGDYGFDRDHLVQVELHDASLEVLRQEMAQHPGVERVSGISTLPVVAGRFYRSFHRPGRDERPSFYRFSGDEDLLATLGVNLVAGRSLSQAEEAGEAVINEAGARALGFGNPAAAVGEQIMRDSDTSYEVVGIMRDFHHDAFFSSIEPAVLTSDRDRTDYALLRAAPEDHAAILSHIEALWPSLDPINELAASPYNDKLDEVLSFEDPLTLIGLTALFALLIAGLGLFGMAAYATQARTKEAGIRKVLGASVPRLTGVLSREFLWVAGASVAIGVPLAWLLNRWWLDFIAYRIDMGISVFLIGLAAILLVLMTTVGLNSYRVATQDPMQALRR